MSSLRIAVMGGRVGESVVIHTPAGKVGVIDAWSCGNRETRDYHHSTLELLEEWKVKHLDCVMVSHPHSDHFGGVLDLLRAYQGRVGHVWMPYPSGPGTNARLLERLKREEAKLLPDDRKEFHEKTRKAYLRLDQWVDEEDRAGRLHREPTTPDRPIRALSAAPDFEVQVLAPTGQALKEWEEGLGAEVFAAARAGRVQHPHHNRIASVVAVRWGSLVALLTSDCERKALQELYTLPHAVELFGKARLVKLPHHGSSTSVDNRFLGRLPGGCAFVLTPFATQGLPDEEARAALQKHQARVQVAGQSWDLPLPAAGLAAPPPARHGRVVFEWSEPTASPKVELVPPAHEWG